MNDDELEIETCESPHDPRLGAHKGIRVKHNLSGKTACSVDMPTQHANKRKTIELLRLKMLKTKT